MSEVTAAVVLYNASKLIADLACTVRSLDDIQCVVYDSHSTDGSYEAVRELMPEATISRGENGGFGYGSNRCLEQIDTEYTLLLNTDASLDRKSLDILIEFLDSNPSYCAVQPVLRLWGWDIVTASRGVFLTQYGEAWDSGFMHLEPGSPPSSFSVPAITAAVSLWRTSVLKALGGFDQGFFMYFEDADLSLRAVSRGHKLGVCPDAAAYHIVGASSSREQASVWELESSVRLFRKYLGNGELNRNWWNRELRIQLSQLKMGRNSVSRLKTIAKARKKPAETITLSQDILGGLFGDPVDMPLHRPQYGQDGPGWLHGCAAPWAGIRSQSGGLIRNVTVEGVDHTVTGALLDSKGAVLRRFLTRPGKPVEMGIEGNHSLMYLKCDCLNNRVKAGYTCAK